MKGFMIVLALWALLMFNSAFNAQAQTGTYAGSDVPRSVMSVDMGEGSKVTWGETSDGEQFSCHTTVIGNTTFTSCN